MGTGMSSRTPIDYIQTIVTYCTIKNTKQLLMTMRNEE